MLKHVLLLAILGCFFHSSQGQIALEIELSRNVETAKTDAEKIAALNKLAEFYTVYLDDKKAGDVMSRQLALAEISADKNLVVHALFNNSLNAISSTSGKAIYNQALRFVNKGLEYAKEAGDRQLEMAAYLRKAGLLRKSGLREEALQQLNIASAVAGEVKNDSLKTELYFESGDLFAANQDYVSAYKVYNSAFDLAYKIKSAALLTAAYQKFAAVYRSLNNRGLAKAKLLESLRLNQKEGYAVGLMQNYFDLFKLESAIDYLNKALYLADSLHSIKDQLAGKRLLFFYLYQNAANSQKALQFLANNEDLRLYFTNQGLMNYNIGAAYQYSGHFDSAVHYYLKDEAVFLTRFSPALQQGYYKEIAESYRGLNKPDSAIAYFEKAFALGKLTGGVAPNDTIASSLAKLYAQKGAHDKAYEYANVWMNYARDLSSAAEQREVTLLEIDREAKQHAFDLENQSSEELRRHNLQYTGISLAIAFLFLAMIFLGMFPVSKAGIRLLNFVSFLCLFEFITLLIDKWLHELTHGEPLRIWLAKIVIIALLLPVHHSLEHVTIKFLSSQKLQHFRRKISVVRFFHPSKKTLQNLEENLEEGTLV